jgi:hypothetical protein
LFSGRFVQFEFRVVCFRIIVLSFSLPLQTINLGSLLMP